MPIGWRRSDACASLVRDAELAEKLATGFTEMWSKAMKDLGEIKFHPMR